MNITLCTFLLNIYYDTIFLQTVRSKSFRCEHNPSLYIFPIRKQFLFRFQIKLISSKSTRFLAISHTDHRLVRIHLESSTHDEEGRRKGRPGSPLIRIINEAARRGWSFADHYPRPSPLRIRIRYFHKHAPRPCRNPSVVVEISL